MITETDLSYIAGLIDGEGCISVSKIRIVYRAERNYIHQHELKVCVIMTDPEPVEFLAKIFGGNVSSGRRQKITPRTIYQWQVCNEKAKNLLQAIYPYSKGKSRQILLALQFPTHIRGERLSEYERDIREDIRLDLIEERSVIK